MWIVTNKGFLSVVANRDKKDHYLIRARNKEAFNNYFEETRVIEMRNSDYRFRVFVDADELGEFTSFIMSDIDYDNFKNSIKDKEVKSMATRMWSIAYSFQNDRYGKQIDDWATTYRNYPVNKSYSAQSYFDIFPDDDKENSPMSHDDILDDYHSDDPFDAVMGEEEMGQFEEKYGMSLDEYLDGPDFENDVMFDTELDEMSEREFNQYAEKRF